MTDTDQKNNSFNTLTQFAVPALTIGAQAATALKFPEWGLIINMLAQPFWIYSAWKAYQKAGQVGMLITVIVVTIILAVGIVNYWII